jgi:signal transduction histidine kinase
VLVIVGVVAIGAGVWMSKTLTAPLEELDEAAEAIGRQELSHRVTVRGSDELKAVASGFNEMAHQLEEAESLRSNLLADVAHELRNPLHVLSGNLQAMLDDVYPMTKEEIARLSDQTRHLTTIVDDLHDLAQAEAHQMPLDRRLVDIAALVKETASAFEAVAGAYDIQLQVELLGTIPNWEVDADRFRQALGNLIINALRHTPGGGQIIVTVQQENQVLCISVRDTGAGMKPEHLVQVFDRFYRTDEARSRDKGGTGLGLAITRAIVEAHGGQISAASPGPGQGSTFTISLPL